MITKHEYYVGGLSLVWEWDEEEINARNFKDNNLYIEGLWSIKDTAPKDYLCTGCQVIDVETFAFTTFGGERFVMKIKDEEIEVASKMLVK